MGLTSTIPSPIDVYKQRNQTLLPGLPEPMPLSPQVSMPGSLSLPMPSLMPVTKAPSPLETEQAKRNYMVTSGAGVDQIHNPFLRGLAKTADVLGSVFTPGLATAIPGTTLHHELGIARENNKINQLETEQKDADQDAQAKAQTGLTQANTDYAQQRPAIEQSKLDNKSAMAHDKNAVALAKTGQAYDADGNIVDDPTSEAYQSRIVLDGVRQSKQELQDAQTAYTNAKHDPNDPLFQQVSRRLAIAQENANAAGLRAQAYMGNYLKGAFNTDLHGGTLPGAPKIVDDAGNTTVVGATNASQAVKANANAAQFNDVHGALDALEQSARALAGSGGAFNSPRVTYALEHSSGTPGQFIQSLDKAGLSPEERSYVQNLVAAHENIQSMRKAAGGGATDTQVSNLLNMLPNGSSPDLNYVLGQLGQIRSTATRIGKGVTTASGGLSVRGQSADNGVEEYVRDASGKLVKKGK